MRKTQTLASIEVDPLTDEQIKKRAIRVEDVDIRGLVKRHRVLEQTLFDFLFLRELITQPQHEAVHMFMDSITRSGACVRSANLDSEVFTPHRDVGNINGERRMAFSSAYRCMVRECGEEQAIRMARCFDKIYQYSQDLDECRALTASLRDAMNALVKHYGTSGVEDPRRILRRLVGAVG